MRPLSKRILHGLEEPIFGRLPQSVVANFDHPGSENALLWNTIYPRCRPSLAWRQLLALEPRWGTALDPAHEPDDQLLPFFWGYAVSGERMPELDRVLEAVDGPGPKTEVDLFLRGREKLVLLEAKHAASPGRCSRFAAGRCPEVHDPGVGDGAGCRYWEAGPGWFEGELDLGGRPVPGGPAPPCNTHYQLARTLLVGQALAGALGLELHLWLLLPDRQWKGYRKAWTDFTRRVRDEQLWRRLRVITWHSLRSIEA